MIRRGNSLPGLALLSRRRALQRLMRLLFRNATRISLSGVEHIPSGPALIVANHLSHADPALLLSIAPRPVEIVGLADLKRRLAAPLYYWYEPIPVRRDEIDRDVLRAILETLAADQPVLIFPEARISRTGALEEARDGIGYLALRARVPVVTVAITGTQQIAAEWKALRRPVLTVTIAPPIMLEEEQALPPRARRRAATEIIMRRLASQLPPEYRGAYLSDGPAPHVI